MTTADWTSTQSWPSGGARFITGWTNAATEIHRVGSIVVPVIMRLSVAEHPQIVIDFARRIFHSDLPFDRYPAAPGSVQVSAESVAPGSASPVPFPGQQLDALLWALGMTAFGDSPAPWLRDGDRYRLTRWPNFTELPHTMDTIRMTALLGAGFLSVPELAQGAAISTASAQRAINALSLMGVVSVAASAETPDVVFRADATQSRGGLFRRLRDRLGL